MNSKKTLLLFIYISYLTTTSGLAVTGHEDDCKISLIIPRESIKSSCDQNQHVLRKVQALERYMAPMLLKMRNPEPQQSSSSILQQNIKDLTQRLMQIETITIPNLEKRIQEVEEKNKADDKKMKERDEKQQPPNNYGLSESITKRKLVKLIRRETKKEIASLKYKEQIKKEIKNEILQEWSLVTNSNNKDPTQLSHENIHTDLQNIRYSAPKKQYKTTDSAIDNEVPEDVKPDYIQADRHTTKTKTESRTSGKKPLDGFKKLELRTETVTTLVNVAVNNITKMFEKIEKLKKEYDKKLLDISNILGGQGLNLEMEQIKARMRSLATEFSSFKQNLYTEPKMQEYFKQVQIEAENRIMAKLSEPSNPIQHELETLKLKVRQQRTVQSSVQVFRRTVENKLQIMENNIIEVGEHLQAINTTLNPDYEVSNEEQDHQVDIIDTINFVKNIRDMWPIVMGNVTLMEEIHKTDFEEIYTNFTSIESRVDRLRANQSKLVEQIKSVKNDIDRMEKLNKLEKALEKGEWVEENFKHAHEWSGCNGGKQYLKKTKYKTAPFVGVVLCSNTRYKIYLGELIDDTFLNIGDKYGQGEDHCEFVGATNVSKISIKGSAKDWETIAGFSRKNWGDVPIKGNLHVFSPTPSWYECGVTIP